MPSLSAVAARRNWRTSSGSRGGATTEGPRRRGAKRSRSDERRDADASAARATVSAGAAAASALLSGSDAMTRSSSASSMERCVVREGRLRFGSDGAICTR